jgi:hypothetical protein
MQTVTCVVIHAYYEYYPSFPSPSPSPHPSPLSPPLPHDNMSYPVSAYDMQRTLPFFMSIVFLPSIPILQVYTYARFQEDTVHHRVDWLLGFFSSRPNWDLWPAGECPHLLVPVGGTHSLAWEGVGSPNSDEGAHTMQLHGTLIIILVLNTLRGIRIIHQTSYNTLFNF